MCSDTPTFDPLGWYYTVLRTPIGMDVELKRVIFSFLDSHSSLALAFFAIHTLHYASSIPHCRQIPWIDVSLFQSMIFDEHVNTRDEPSKSRRLITGAPCTMVVTSF